jgi:hypothetical protein
MPSEKWTIKSPLSGEALAEFIVEMQPLHAAETKAPETRGNGRPREDRGEKLTDPQRRFLFRLLAAQKVEGKQAEAHLREYFRVSQIGDITKADASEYINQLAKDRKDAGA